MSDRCKFHPEYDPTKGSPFSGCQFCWQRHNWVIRVGLEDIRRNPIPRVPDFDCDDHKARSAWRRK